MREVIRKGNPLPPPELHTLASIAAKWQGLPSERKRRAYRWIRQWSALNGGFRIEPGEGGMVHIEPARLAEIGEGRAIRRRVEELIGELKAKPEMADDIQTDALLKWRMAKAAPGDNPSVQ